MIEEIQKKESLTKTLLKQNDIFKKIRLFSFIGLVVMLIIAFITIFMNRTVGKVFFILTLISAICALVTSCLLYTSDAADEW